MMGSTLPSPEQINFFNTFGYLAFPGLMADTIDQITGEFEAVWEERGGGHNGTRGPVKNHEFHIIRNEPCLT